MSLMVQQSASQQSSIRAKLEAESKDRFNFFDLDLLKAMASSQYGNLLLSPASIKFSLAMLLEGAGGNSAKEVKEALRLPDDEKVVRQQFYNLLNSLQVKNPPNVVEAGNRIFISSTFSPQQQYQITLNQYYRADIARVDFLSPLYAAQSINGWVNMVTHGQIPSLVDPGSISRRTNLMLTSAMYFKGKWQHAFDLDKTTQSCFYVDVGQCFNANFMENVNIYKYAYSGSLEAQAVELPYEGHQFSLLLLLPTKRNAIQQLIRDLSHASLHNIVSSLEATDILISLPRFSIDYSTDLVHALNELKIEEIFSTNANLTGMIQLANYELHVSNFLHKAKIEISEEGTVAAAATGTLVVPLMGTSIPKLIFDHPFLFFLRNTQTGDILFAGRVSQPEPAKQRVSGLVNESELSQLTKDIFTSTPVAGAGRSVGSTLSPQFSGSNNYNPPFAGSVSIINKSHLVSQSQPPVTNYQTSPNNQNTANNNPLPTMYQTFQATHRVRSVSNDLPQPNIAQYQSHSNSETYHASNPDTIGQNVQSPGQSLSTSRSYVPDMNRPHYLSAQQKTPEQEGVWKIYQSDNERRHVWS